MAFLILQTGVGSSGMGHWELWALWKTCSQSCTSPGRRPYPQQDCALWALPQAQADILRESQLCTQWWWWWGLGCVLLCF